MSLETATLAAEECLSEKKKQILASFASSVIPGMGQAFLHNGKSAVICFAFFFVGIGFFWPFRIITHYHSWIFSVLYLLTVCITSAWLALRRAPANNPIQPSVRWLVAVIPFACLTSLLWMTGLQRVAGLRPFKVSSSSMERTVFEGDSIAADFHYYRNRTPQRGEIIVFRHNNIFLIKRTIAIEGDTVSSRDGVVSVNGIALDEPYVQHVGNAPPEMNSFTGIKVPSGTVFVLGDNRDLSLDSRESDFGFVALSDVQGKVSFVTNSSHDQTGRSF